MSRFYLRNLSVPCAHLLATEIVTVHEEKASRVQMAFDPRQRFLVESKAGEAVRFSPPNSGVSP